MKNFLTSGANISSSQGIFCLLELVISEETWSVTLKENHRLNMFETRVPRRKFGLKREEITVGLKIDLRNEYLHKCFRFAKYYQCEQIKKDVIGACSTH